MKSFKHYLETSKVKKRSVDIALANSLIQDAQERIETIKDLDKEKFKKILFENTYDALRDVLDAVLAVEGYKSYSHEASIANLAGRISDTDITELDEFRSLRNSSKYYGKGITVQDVENILLFWKEHADELIRIVRKKEQLFEKLDKE